MTRNQLRKFCEYNSLILERCTGAGRGAKVLYRMYLEGSGEEVGRGTIEDLCL